MALRIYRGRIKFKGQIKKFSSNQHLDDFFLHMTGLMIHNYVRLLMSKFQADFIELPMRCFHCKATGAIDILKYTSILFWHVPPDLEHALLSYSGSMNNKFFMIVLT